MEKFEYTTPGPRKNNEDYYAFRNINDSAVFCVADGVGGNLCGEFASKFCVDEFITELSSIKKPVLQEILYRVHEKLKIQSLERPNCKGMATTFTSMVLTEKSAELIHTGDSRVYLLRGNGLRQLTEDHTEVKRLVKEGRLSTEAALSYPRKNVLESALGISGGIKTTALKFDCVAKDRIIIATDGFYGVFTKIELRDISKVNVDFKAFCNVLVNQLEKKMLTDNATFIAIQV